MTIFPITTLVLSSVLAFSVSPSAAQGSVDAAKDGIGAAITIQGCVVEGERAGSFVLTRLKEWPVRSQTGEYGPRHYWFEKTPQEFGNHVGNTIQIAGTISEVKESEVERNPGLDGKDGARVAIELPTGDVITTPGNAGVPLKDGASKVDMKVTLLKVKVDKVLVVMKGCLPQ